LTQKKQDKDLFEDLPEALDFWLQNRLLAIHTAIPGVIQNYDPSKRKCDVKPSINLPFPGGRFLEPPLIQGVPVCIPGSAQYMLDFEIPNGTTCQVHFSEVGIGEWLKGAKQPDADAPSRFKLTDAMVIPGLWQYGKVPKIVNGVKQTGDNVAHTAKGTHSIDAKEVHFNGSDKVFVTQQELQTVVDAFLVELNSHIHITTATVGATAVLGVLDPPTDSMSLDTSPSATTTVKTGG